MWKVGWVAIVAVAYHPQLGYLRPYLLCAPEPINPKSHSCMTLNLKPTGMADIMEAASLPVCLSCLVASGCFRTLFRVVLPHPTFSQLALDPPSLVRMSVWKGTSLTACSDKLLCK